MPINLYSNEDLFMASSRSLTERVWKTPSVLENVPFTCLLSLARKEDDVPAFILININYIYFYCFFSVSSLRLAYKDLELEMKEEKLSGKKKTEVDRLGMGFSKNRRYV